MNRFSVLIAVAIALAIGIAIGHAITPAPELRHADGRSSVDIDTPGNARRVHPDGPDTASKAPGKPPEVGSPMGEAPEKTGRDPMKELIEKTNVESPPRGTGRITGLVKLSDGAPLPGVRVRARGYTAYYARWRNGEEPSLEEELTHVIRRKKYASATALEATTGDDGRFELAGAAEIEYSLDAKLDGYRIVLHNPQVRAGTHIVLVAEPIVTLLVRMERRDGKPVTRGLLCQGREAKKEARSSGFGWYPESPELQFLPGTYFFWGEDQADKAVSSEIVTLKLEAGVKPAELVLVLKELPGIAGKVILPEEENQDAWPTVTVAFFGNDPAPASFDPLKVRGRPTQSMDCRSWESWQYSFPDCKPGNYLVYVMLERSVVTSAVVTVSDQLVRLDLKVPAPSRNDFVVVRAYGPDEKLLDDLSFNIRKVTDGGSGSYGSQAKRKSDGSYWIQKERITEEERDDTGTRWFVVVSSKNYGTKEVEFDVNTRDDIVVRFQAPAFVVASVSGAIDAEYKDRLHITVRKGVPKGAGSWSPGAGTRLESGQCKLGPFDPDKYVVQLLLSGADRHFVMVLAEVELSLASGENSAVLAVPPLYTVTVQLKEAIKGQRVSLGTQGRNGVERISDKDGVVVFADVLAGNYTLRVNYGESMNIEVTQSATIVFVPQIMNAIRIRIDKPDCYAAAVGFQTDDLIIAANGVVFTDEDQMYRALYPRGAKKVKLTVARGSTTLDIEIEIDKFAKPDGGFSTWSVSR